MDPFRVIRGDVLAAFSDVEGLALDDTAALELALQQRFTDSTNSAPCHAAHRLKVSNRAGLQTMNFGLPGTQVHRPSYWRLTNKTAHRIEISRFSLNGAGWLSDEDLRDWFDLDEPMSARALGLGIYLFCRRHQTHGPAPCEDWRQPEITTPTWHFSAFGYGLCGHSAHSVLGLARLLQVPARVQRIGFHTFAELKLNGRWQIIDPNGQTWYPDAEHPQRMLGLRELVQQTEAYWQTFHFRALGRGKTHAQLISRLTEVSAHQTVTEDVQLAPMPESSRKLRLEPQESATFHYTSHSPWATSREHALWLSSFNPPENVRALVFERRFEAEELAQHLFQPADAPGLSRLTYDIRRDWPLQDVDVRGLGLEGNVRVYLRRADGTRVGAFQQIASAPGVRAWRLRRAIHPDASTLVQLEVDFERVPRAGTISVSAHYQYSLFSFPQPLPGENPLRIGICEPTPGDGDLEIELGLRAANAGVIQKLPDMSLRVGKTQGGGLSFRWDADVDNDGQADIPTSFLDDPVREGRLARSEETVAYEFMVTRAPHPFELAGPSLHRYLTAPAFSLANPMRAGLESGKTFHWRVRLVDAWRKPLSRWAPFSAFVP